MSLKVHKCGYCSYLTMGDNYCEGLSLSFSHCSHRLAFLHSSRMLAGFLGPTIPMHTVQVSIAMPLADHPFGSRYPEAVPQPPSATSVRTLTGRGSAWINTGGRFSQ